MLLGIAGFHLADLRHIDLSSRGFTRAYYATQAKAVRYYENMRLVYEIESRVRDLRRAATPDTSAPDQKQQQQEAPAPKPTPKNPSKSDNRQAPVRQNQQYSRDHGQPELAAFPAAGARMNLSAGVKGRTLRCAAPASYSCPSEWASAQAVEQAINQARLNRRTA